MSSRRPNETLRKLRGHDFITDEELAGVPGYHKSADDPVCSLKYFSPYTGWTWYVLEIVEQREDGDLLFYGFVAGDFPELGDFVFGELEELLAMGVPVVERDCYYTPEPLSAIRARHTQ